MQHVLRNHLASTVCEQPVTLLDWCRCLARHCLLDGSFHTRHLIEVIFLRSCMQGLALSSASVLCMAGACGETIYNSNGWLRTVQYGHDHNLLLLEIVNLDS
jgi:hypothetical protein